MKNSNLKFLVYLVYIACGGKVFIDVIIFRDISTKESHQAAAGIENLDNNLGVGLLCDSSPSVRYMHNRNIISYSVA